MHSSLSHSVPGCGQIWEVMQEKTGYNMLQNINSLLDMIRYPDNILSFNDSGLMLTESLRVLKSNTRHTDLIQYVNNGAKVAPVQMSTS